MKTIYVSQLSTQASYKYHLMRKKDNLPIIAKKIGKGVRLRKFDLQLNAPEFKDEMTKLEADGWLLVLENS